ncbi:geranylgeranylglycerol-phosphate geranylgeranyltransferase [Deminuibacter soli]|nr:geranylgeranylglycerol-phosphate geranylgeranyltransferase [Deminuibacter soli]
MIVAFFRLIRWPNLVFIALTQVLFNYAVIRPVLLHAGLQPNLQGCAFAALALAFWLVAAAGYIINDYFDYNIDIVNKPNKVVVGKIISRRWTIIWHLVFSLSAVALGFYMDITTRIHLMGPGMLLTAALLFLYSISLKRKLLWGNILVSLLTAWSVLGVTWCESSNLIQTISLHLPQVNKITRITFLYAGFAFIISLIREVVKDMEDVEGDRRYGCNTMPIAWGINATKVFVAVWMVVLIALLVIVLVYVLLFGWWMISIYFIVLVTLPLLWVFRKLFTANEPADYHRLSSVIKMVMFTGILSMLFFSYYQ